MYKSGTFLITILAVVYVGQTFAQVQVNSFVPVEIVGGTGQILSITGSGFGASKGTSYVSFIQQSGGYLTPEQGNALKYHNWTDSKIELEMPVAYSGKIQVTVNATNYFSNDTLNVMANLGYRNVNPLVYDYLTNKNSRGGLTWHMHRTYWENPEAKEAIEDVFREFRCKTGVNYTLANEPSDATFNLGDGINLIAPDSALSAAGYNDKMWSSCIAGETFYYTSALDIRLSAAQNWYFGKGKVPNGKSKFRYVLMHELGHSLGLGHVDELGQTMYPSVTLLPSNNWSERDSITIEEQIAISHFIKRSQEFTFRACGINPMQTVTNCTEVYEQSSGITKMRSEDVIKIYPNPTYGSLTIDISGCAGTDKTVEILNHLGQVLDRMSIFNSSGESELKLDLGRYESGIYFISVQDAISSYTLRVLKID